MGSAGSVQAGTSTSMSRGKLMTEACEWSSAMCMSIVTSLSTALLFIGVAEPVALSFAAVAADDEQVHAALDGTDVGYAFEHFDSLPSVDLGFSVCARSKAAYAATAEPETSATATTEATTFAAVFHKECRPRRPWRASEGDFAARREVVRTGSPTCSSRVGWSRVVWSRGGRGIRTHEALLPTGFQDQLHRPLGQPSMPARRSPEGDDRAGRHRF